MDLSAVSSLGGADMSSKPASSVQPPLLVRPVGLQIDKSSKEQPFMGSRPGLACIGGPRPPFWFGGGGERGEYPGDPRPNLFYLGWES